MSSVAPLHTGKGLYSAEWLRFSSHELQHPCLLQLSRGRVKTAYFNFSTTQEGQLPPRPPQRRLLCEPHEEETDQCLTLFRQQSEIESLNFKFQCYIFYVAYIFFSQRLQQHTPAKYGIFSYSLLNVGWQHAGKDWIDGFPVACLTLIHHRYLNIYLTLFKKLNSFLCVTVHDI